MRLLRWNNAGFSLLELIVVMVIIGLGSALVAPRLMGSFDSLEIRSAARKTVSMIRFARSQAVFNSSHYQMRISATENRIILDKILRTEPIPGFGLFSLETVQEISLGKNIRIAVENFRDPLSEDGYFHFVFFPSGTSRCGTIVYLSGGGERVRVVMDDMTGLARLDEQ